MKLEAQTVKLILSLKSNNYSPQELAKVLFEEGHTTLDKQPFSIPQVNSFIHSANQAKRKAQRVYLESCGIDREANPCGDASDY